MCLQEAWTHLGKDACVCMAHIDGTLVDDAIASALMLSANLTTGVCPGPKHRVRGSVNSPQKRRICHQLISGCTFVLACAHCGLEACFADSILQNC